MDYYPLYMDIKNKPCLVVGGGTVAARKIEALLKAGAEVTVVASVILSETKNLPQKRVTTGDPSSVLPPQDDRACYKQKPFEPSDVDGQILVIAATDDEAVNEAVSKAAREKNILVNVVDNKELSDFIVPSIVDRSPLLIAISTSGASPYLSKKIRMELESRYGPEYIDLLKKASECRESMTRIKDENEKRRMCEKMFPEKTGKVYLAGAGPGDPGLITVRAMELLRTSDVILYDSLVNPTLLNQKRPDAEAVYCGKRGLCGSNEACHPAKAGGGDPDNLNVLDSCFRRNDSSCETNSTQSEINDLMLKYADEGKNVLRLKGGDPWLFSRGAEEAEFLTEHNIPFEVVPAVTSPIAAAAYAGIPISHRGFSSSVAIATGRPASGKDIEDLNVPDADTIIYLMAIDNLAAVVNKLRKAGKPDDLPAALIQDATTRRQRTVTGNLGSIAGLALKEGIKAPAIFIVGEVVKLHGRLNWYESLPLFGRRLILTRPASQADGMIKQLTELGADVIPLPTIEIKEIEYNFVHPSTNSGRTENSFVLSLQCPEPVEGSKDGITDIIFTSENGVRIFFKKLFASGLDARELSGKKVYAIGPNTADEILENGIMPEPLAEKFTSEGLLQTLPNDLSGRKFLLPRAAEANRVLEDGLKKRGAEIFKLALYTIECPSSLSPLGRGQVRGRLQVDPPPHLPPNHRRAGVPLPKGRGGNATIDGVIFTSAMTVKNFFEMAKWPEGATAFCIGETTAAELGGKDIKVIVSHEATSDALVEKVLRYFSESASPPWGEVR